MSAFGWLDTGQRDAVNRVTAAIAEDPAGEWEIDDMARLAGFSKFHFTRVFTRHTGTTPHRWLLRYRVELAKELLTRTGRSIGDITRVVGYQSIGTFSSRFALIVGCPPSAYRYWHAYAEELTELAGYQGQFYRQAAAADCSLSPSGLPRFGETLEELEQQLEDSSYRLANA